MFISSFYKLRSGYWDDLIPIVQAIIVTAAHQLSMKTKYLLRLSAMQEKQETIHFPSIHDKVVASVALNCCEFK